MREIPCHYVPVLYCSPRRTGRSSVRCASCQGLQVASALDSGRLLRPSQDRSRITHHSLNHSPDDITALLRMAHDRHERRGARKIKRWLKDQGHTMPAFSTVHNLMARHGLLPGTSPGIPATGRFEPDAPNRLWQMDFKGHFSFGGGRCHPLILLDDHSCFSLCLAHCTDERR